MRCQRPRPTASGPGLARPFVLLRRCAISGVLGAVIVVGASASLPAQMPWFRRVLNLLRPEPPPAITEEKPGGAEPDTPPIVVLPDNGDLRRKLEQVRQQIEGQHYSEAAGQLGHFLQDRETSDFFLSRDDERRGLRGFQAEVRRLLGELPDEGKASYRVQFEPIARSRLNAAIAQSDESALRDVALRFPETRSADEAWYRLGHRLWDRGRAGAALVCLERLASRPHAAVLLEPGLTRLLAACRSRMDAASTATEEWTTYRGNTARNRSVAARAPFLAPRWSNPASSDAQTQLAIERASQAYRDDTATELPLLSPLAAGGLVFARTARGVAAFDLDSGLCRWRHPSDDDDDNAGLDRVVWQEPGGGAFSVDDQCVYLLEEVRGVAVDAGVPGLHLLSAREHFQSHEGKLRWQVGGPDGGAEPRLAGAEFLGAPLCRHDRLYVLIEMKRTLVLAVLDRDTGCLDWSQDLAQIEQDLPDDHSRCLSGATPSIAGDDVIICPTSGGAVVAIDLPTRSLSWAYRYARRAPGSPIDDDTGEPTVRLDQFDRWLDATIAIGQGSAVLTPCESREIHCLDITTGEPRWTKPRGDGMYVGCLSGGLVVVVGRREVTALRLVDGSRAWARAYRNKAHPAGRGVFADDRYFLPTTAATILEIELATGALIAEHKSPRELIAGNLIWHRGLFLSQGPFALEAFDERERLTQHVRDELERDPHDAAALIRRGELELASGRVSEAIANYRAAHDSARSARTRSRLVSALLEAVRQNLPESEKYAAELDDLIGP